MSSGLLINDNRDPQRPVTILAERAAFADTPTGPRIVMVNGNRQQFDPKTRKLSILTFDTLHARSRQLAGCSG